MHNGHKEHLVRYERAGAADGSDRTARPGDLQCQSDQDHDR